MKNEPVLKIEDLKTYFFLDKVVVKALNGVTLSMHKNETLGLVGESGCGKSLLAMSIIKIFNSPPGDIIAGSIWLQENDSKINNLITCLFCV